MKKNKNFFQHTDRRAPADKSNNELFGIFQKVILIKFMKSSEECK
jgi:hypothetical protein